MEILLVTINRTIQRIFDRGYSRVDLIRLRDNALAEAAKGSVLALEVIKAIDSTGVPPKDRKMAFMGFCPAGDIKNRLDVKWIAEGICEFGFFGSEHQHDRFAEIMVGDTVILKKREQFGETMRLYAYGLVAEVIEIGARLRMDWKSSGKEIVVPLMGCNSTVDMKSIETVVRAMPKEFWEWMGEPKS